MTGSFEGCKVVVVDGSGGVGKGTAADVVAGGGSAVIIGRDQVEAVREQLASGHTDAALLVTAAGFFIPKPFLE